MATGGGEAVPGPKTMRLRYAGTCRACGMSLAVGTTGVYDRSTKSVSCVQCPAPAPLETAPGDAVHEPPPPPPAEVEAGVAGSSARREFERRSAARETRIRDAHPRLGGLMLAVSEQPQSTTAWARGAKGEEQLGRGLDSLADKGVRMLHDRRIPRTRANIDHIAVAPSGVYVIDAKRYAGRPTLQVEGGIIRPRTSRLVIGSRDGTKLVEGVHKQVGLVRDALAAADHDDIPARGMLCFVDADWPLFGGSFQIDGADVLWPRKAYERLTAPGTLAPTIVDEIHRRLAEAFPIA